MEPLIDILSCTANQFAEKVFEKLGKGKLLAKAIYREWCKHGSLEKSDSYLEQEAALHEKILSLVSWPQLTPRLLTQEGETIKFTLPLVDGYETESVIIPMQSGTTLCLSSQVGCRMGCKFCETGRLGLLRQLTPSEIVAQLVCAKEHFQMNIRNIVFMGMGEPMDNLDAVIPAIEIFTDPRGFNLGRRHITVSTSGHLDGLQSFQERLHPPVNLAVSVIASNEQMRTKLMPVNRKWNMQALYKAMKHYCETTKRQIFIEYVLIDSMNDSLEHADELAEYLKGLDVKVNLIAYNAQSSPTNTKLALAEPVFKSSPPERCEAFAAALHAKGLRTLLRRRKGHDIMAACGQLGNLKWKKSIANSSISNS